MSQKDSMLTSLSETARMVIEGNVTGIAIATTSPDGVSTVIHRPEGYQAFGLITAILMLQQKSLMDLEVTVEPPPA